MSDHNMPTTDQPESRRSSRLVFFVLWLLILSALLFPAAPVLGLHGGLLGGLGVLMILLPPQARLPKWMFVVAGLFVALSAAAFLPKAWFAISAWRQGLDAAGLDTGNKVTAHAAQSWWQWVQLCGVVIGAIYILGHRVTDRVHLWFHCLFSSAVAVMAVLAIAAQSQGWEWPWDSDPSFGFFPNRNHTATVLAMGGLTALGGLFHSVRSKQHLLAGLASLNLCLCSGAAVAFSPSRAGILLLVLGGLVWLAGLGKRYFSKKLIGASVGIAGLGVVLFFMLGGEVRDRLAKTAERVQVSMNQDPTASAQANQNDSTADFRLLIFKDAWSMIRQEPPTGVGMGMFGYVFPQYRNASASGALCVHPESDWLMLAGEQGWLTALLLAGGVVALLSWAVRMAWNRHGWSLRWNGIVAAGLLPLHGLFDVPGHRWGIVLGAVFLLSLTLREGHRAEALGSLGKMIWRGIGVIVLGCGGLFLLAQGNAAGGNALTQPEYLQHQAKALYAQDVAERDITPPPDPEGLKLEKAIELLGEASKMAPLDPDLHYLRGYLALNFTDEKFVAMRDQEFDWQRRLAPLWVQIPMRQAEVYAPIDAKKTMVLWEDGLRRAEIMKELGPGTDWERVHVIERAIYQSYKADDTLKAAALELAKTDAREFVVWSHNGNLEQLNQLIPETLGKLKFSPEQRETLLKIWTDKGGAEAVTKYRAEHP